MKRKTIERKIGEVFKCATGDMVVCERAIRETSCLGCMYADSDFRACTDESIGKCTKYMRSDGIHVVFRKI